ncbi:MAG: CBS domain-containing protein [Methylocystaceae bacterium]|nr:CBS domain-containing protein [Methylocystaceae bacterium]
MHKQTKIFAKRVVDFMHTPKVCMELGSFCETVITHMADQQAQCCIVLDSHGKLAGILRKDDILSRIVFKVGPNALIDDVMDDKVQTIRPDEYLYHAIGRMRRQNVREIVVVNEAMQPVGIVYLRDAIEIAASHLMEQIDRLSAEGDIDSLREVKAAQVDLAADMFEDNQPATAIQQLLSHVNNDIYSKIVHDNICHMDAEGWGKPPVEFCVIVMGSGGRGENYLYPDQDNGFILEDYDDNDHTRVDEYFRELANRMCRDLNEVGFPYCTGDVMATNPLWRKTVSQWVEQVSLWGRKRNSLALRMADIFFDFKPVWGKNSLAKDLRFALTEMLKSNHFFLQEMYSQQVDHNVAINIFGRLQREEEGDHVGKVDIKYRGTLPLVEAVRLLSFKHGFEETGTLARIERLHLAKVLSDAEKEYLETALTFLTKLLLKNQIRAFQKDQTVTRFINPNHISQAEKEELLRSLRHIEAFRKRMKGEFTADVF